LINQASTGRFIYTDVGGTYLGLSFIAPRKEFQVLGEPSPILLTNPRWSVNDEPLDGSYV
jgi:hypothetical protein